MGTFNRRLWSSVLSFPLVMTGTQAVGAEHQQASPGNSSGPTGQGVALTEQELNNRVSPIALYPDALVAQIVAASTFPDQVGVADNWLQQNTSLTGSALMQAVNTQSWDRSVKALTQVPSVLNNMAQNLARASQLARRITISSRRLCPPFSVCASRPKPLAT